MIRTLHADPRRGYTLTIVLVFLILLFALWTTVYRTTSSLLRIETNRILQQTRDQSAINALAQAVQLLEYGKPSSPGNPSRAQFTYGVTETVPNADGSCGAATLDYTIVYTFSPLGILISGKSRCLPEPTVSRFPKSRPRSCGPECEASAQ
jgi:Tfp pilus assembly protein PilX